MKKLAFMFVAVAAMSFASCGNKAEQPAEEVATDTVETVVEDTTAADSVVADSTVADSVVAE